MGNWCFGDNFHKFEPRYDEIEEIDAETRDAAIRFYKEDSMAPMIDFKKTKKVYVCDICAQCGLVIDRKKCE